MKISCKIIEDLLPLYHDGVCSEESKIVEREHLKDCERCKDFLNTITNETFEMDVNSNIEESRVNSLKLLKKRLLRKNIIISLLSIVGSIVILCGGNYLLFHNDHPISYEAGLVDVSMAEDEVIDIYFKGKDYYKSYALTKTIKTDGVEQDIVLIYFTETPWTKYFSPINDLDGNDISIGNEIIVDFLEEEKLSEFSRPVSAVYYLVADYRELNSPNMSDKQFNQVMQDAVLLWKK